MKFVSFFSDVFPKLGILVKDYVYDLHQINPHIATNMADFLVQGEQGMSLAKIVEKEIMAGRFSEKRIEEFSLSAPVPFPASCRDGYAFRQHVATSRRNRGMDMAPEFEQFPVFYFTNHQAMYGPGEIKCMPDHFNKLDFELEVAVVMNKKGKNILAKDADSYIAGYMIMNDLSARALQMEEMKLNLGPAKGKDFATVIGPWLVTPDELAAYSVSAPLNHTGATYCLNMSCSVNGKQVSKGNFENMHWTFAEIVERASYGVEIFPGDVIGSGTVGTGCFLELNGTGKLNNPDYKEQWLQPGDVIEMHVDGLGELCNTLTLSASTKHILKK